MTIFALRALEYYNLVGHLRPPYKYLFFTCRPPLSTHNPVTKTLHHRDWVAAMFTAICQRCWKPKPGHGLMFHSKLSITALKGQKRCSLQTPLISINWNQLRGGSVQRDLHLWETSQNSQETPDVLHKRPKQLDFLVAARFMTRLSAVIREGDPTRNLWKGAYRNQRPS